MDMEIKEFDKLSGFRIQCTKDLLLKGSLSAIVVFWYIIYCSWYDNFLEIKCQLPIYCILGISISFALTFSLIDLINYLIGFIQGSITRPLIESVAQVYMILLFTITMGGIFGFIFGLLDVEDESSHHIRLALMKAENCCFPLGAVLGGIAGFGNEVFRQQSEAYKIENVTEFDDEV
ncbi:hypothetical protein PFMG_01092 [Plasmodium falciparum IGH-CR14]|uniref:Uncharacterized protein n=1 Tax=Plasmodium falciparum IGH-CR14 TaxID=580059 RepID=A0A0L1I7C0_PLAFA|nr:hypothetical protein PFMG_01092 [Plasmodium falciparum IGH-CR14]